MRLSGHGVRRRFARPYPVAWLKWEQPRPPFPAHQLGYLSFGARWVTAPLRGLPDYLVIGASKSATTSLHEYLASHPDVCPPLRKEIRYFDRHHDRGLAWYRAHFPTRAARHRVTRRTGRPTLTGESTPSYLPSAEVPGRVAASLPAVKLVAILRDPVDRAVSHYSMRAARGLDPRPIDEALVPGSGYLHEGRYAEHLERWHAQIPADRLLVIQAEALTREPEPGFDRVLEFLELRAWRPPSFEMHLAGSYAPAPAAVRGRLRAYYDAPNAQLWDLLGERWDWDDAGAREARLT